MCWPISYSGLWYLANSTSYDKKLLTFFSPFTLSVSFGFQGPPLLTFKSDRLDLRGFDPGKSDVKGSLA